MNSWYNRLKQLN